MINTKILEHRGFKKREYDNPIINERITRYRKGILLVKITYLWDQKTKTWEKKREEVYITYPNSTRWDPEIPITIHSTTDIEKLDTILNAYI